MRTLCLALLFSFLIAAGSGAKAEEGIMVLKGTVKSIDNDCFRDGTCSFVLETQESSVSIIWNQGNVLPSVAASCQITEQVSYAAEHLKVGQEVEVHMPASSGHILCGKASAIIPLRN